MIELNCPACGKLLRIDDQYRGTTGACKGCGAPIHVPPDALTTAQKSLLAQVRNPIDIPQPEPSDDWRDDPASARQLSYLADLGASANQMRGITKGEASELIDELLENAPRRDSGRIAEDMAHSQREMVKAQKQAARAIQQQTNTIKNACGCLIILLTAPLWIPFLLYLIGSQ